MHKFFFIFLIFLCSTTWGREPNLKELEKVALRYAGVDPLEIQRWKKRVRLANLLPRITVGYSQDVYNQENQHLSDSISVTSSGVVIGPTDSSFDQDYNTTESFDVRATWALDELLFDRDILNIASESRYRTVVRTQILEDLHQAWFERKKILLHHDGPSAFSKLKLEELEAKIDALTGGYFLKVLAEPEKNEPTKKTPKHRF